MASSEGFSLLEDAHFPVFSHDVKHAVLVEAAELSIEDISQHEKWENVDCTSVESLLILL